MKQSIKKNKKPDENRLKLFRIAAVPGTMVSLLRGQLRFLNQHYDVSAIASNDFKLPLLEEQEGIRTFPVNIERTIKPISDLAALYKLYRLFRKEKPFIVHSITPKAGLLSMSAAYFARVPKRIHTFTGLIFPTSKGFKKWMLLNFDRLICFFATHVYPEGIGVRNDLIAHKVTKKHLKVIANGNVNGIDLDHFNPELYTDHDRQSYRASYGIDQNDYVFVFIGRLVKDKGIRELVHAFSKIEKENSNVKLLLVGHVNSEVDQLPDETWQEINNNNKINFIGIQEDVRPSLLVSDVLVFPSYREGFPNVVLEAGAMGLPTIATDINGCNEIIETGINGIIIPPKNQKALYDSMSNILQDQELVKRLALNARPIVQKKYNRYFVWECLLEEYKNIVGQDN